jgi:deoxyadenosine/deoxycytidine kinase
MLNLCITGNMASGKTTFARLLSSHLANACVIPEPVEANLFLSLYLLDQRRWGFTAQLRYFADYVQTFEHVVRASPCDCRIIDAGIWTNQFVYTKYLHDHAIITDDEFTFYQRLCADIVQAHPTITEPDAFIFIEASPETCLRRLHQRGHEYQTTSVTLDYMTTLHRYFHEMQRTMQSRHIPTLAISSADIDYTGSSGRDKALSLVEGFLDLHQLTYPR